MEQEFKKQTNDAAIEKERQGIELLKAEHKKLMAEFENELKAADDAQKAQLERAKTEMEMQAKYYTGNILKNMMLENARLAYVNGPRTIEVQQVGANVQDNLDLGGQSINQVFNSFKELEGLLGAKAQGQIQSNTAAAGKK